MNKKWILIFFIASLLIISMSVYVTANEESNNEEENNEENGNIEVFDTIAIIILSLAIIITFVLIFRRKDLFKYFLGFVSIFFSHLFRSIEEATAIEFYCILASISILIAAIIFFLAILNDYFTQVLNKGKMNIKKEHKNKLIKVVDNK